MKVLTTRPLGERKAEQLRLVAERNGARAELLQVDHKDAFAAALPTVDVIYGGYLTADEVALATRLRWLYADYAGVEKLPLAALQAAGVTISNARGVGADTVADHVLLLLLSLNRGLAACVLNQAQGRWEPHAAQAARVPVPAPTTAGVAAADPADAGTQGGADGDGPGGAALAVSGGGPRPLRDQTLCVVGYGAIGRAVAQRALAFGMRVTATRRGGAGTVPAGVAAGGAAVHVSAPEHLPAMLAEADAVVLTTPLTPDTRHLFDAAMFHAMKPGAVFVNIGRGGCVDESALLHALESGRLAGAALDVFEEEPLPAGHPLWTARNLLVSPHVAGAMEGYLDRTFELFLENVPRYIGGQPLLNTVDAASGY